MGREIGGKFKRIYVYLWLIHVEVRKQQDSVKQLSINKNKLILKSCQYFLDHRKSKRVPEKIYFCLIGCAKAFDCITKNWKILQEMGIPDHHTCLMRNLYTGQEATVRTGHGTTDWFRLGKEYAKAVYFHLAYLTFMQSTSCKMLGWMK